MSLNESEYFGPDRGEIPGLDLDQSIAANNINHVAIHLNLKKITGLGKVIFQGGVE
jgi:hypothetical protein